MSINALNAPSKRKGLRIQAKTMWKLRDDSWGSNPPQVKSYLAYSTSEPFAFADNKCPVTYTSPICGFGWRFQLSETFRYSTSLEPRIQELLGRIDLSFEPNMCSSMPLSNVKINVKVSYPSGNSKAIQEEQFTNISIKSASKIGTYTEPKGYKGQVHFEIALTFSSSDGLPLPTTVSFNTKRALRHSLDGPSFVDTKFYLFSARIQGRPARPKAVFANSLLLMESSTYLHDLLSTASGFANGTPCGLHEDAAKEIAKLDVNAYDYDSDSDLEDEDEEGEGKDRSSMTTLPSKIEKDSGSDKQLEEPAVAGAREDRAFAIDGTAYKTWKAFLYYCYTNDIRFNALRSQSNPTILADPAPGDPDITRCSPKSMYRFADYANLPELQTLAKEAIQKNLSQSNIVAELFSRFTSKYQEIVDLEIRYLVDNFTYGVINDFDEMLEKIVAGSMPHCAQVLKLSIKELRTANSQGTKLGTFAGWGKSLKPPALQAPTIFQVPLSSTNAPTPDT